MSVCRTHGEDPFVIEGEADGECVVEGDQGHCLKSSQQQGHCEFQYYIAWSAPAFRLIGAVIIVFI